MAPITAYPTAVPITSYPTAAPIITQPVYYGSPYCNISLSSGSSGGSGYIKVDINAGNGIQSVYVVVSDGRTYEYNDSGNGIKEILTLTGNGLRVNVNAYDAYGNLISSSSGNT